MDKIDLVKVVVDPKRMGQSVVRRNLSGFDVLLSLTDHLLQFRGTVPTSGILEEGERRGERRQLEERRSERVDGTKAPHGGDVLCTEGDGES